MRAEELPIVSVIVPCRNEENFIGRCLDSILVNDYPHEKLEILVVDGMSEDQTRDIVDTYARQHPNIKLADNPKKILAAAWNIGIRRARGSIVMAMNAHTTFGSSYIATCVKYLGEYDAEYVGGRIVTVPSVESPIGWAIAVALSHHFGVGTSYFRIGCKEPMWADTAAFGGYRMELFERVGLFNEELVRSQDMEFHRRVKKAGGKILLVPAMVGYYYYTRADLASFCRHSFVNGFWTIYPLKFRLVVFGWGHLVPLAFVLGLFGSAALALVSSVGLWMLFGVGGAYAVANLAASVQVAMRESGFRYVVVMPVVFASLHVSYGFGSLWGLVEVIAHTLSKLGCKQGERGQPC